MKERRKYVRVPHVTDVTVNVLGGAEEEFICLCRDLGADGMRVHVDKEIDNGVPVKVTFSIPTESSPLIASGNIIRRKWMHTGITDIGIEFVDMDPAVQSKIISYIVRYLTG